MSANRSVQAAQRRRMGQEMSSNQRGPQPSINSSQMFVAHAQQGQGRYPPQMQQQQPMYSQKQMYAQQQQMHQQQQPIQQNNDTELSGISKLTIAQAITLITLRLGALETKAMNTEGVSSSLGENMVAIDRGLLDAIMERLDTLEKRPVSAQMSATSATSSAEINMIKQQFEPIKQTTIQTKNAIVSLSKETKDLKSNYDNLRQELSDTKELLNSLQTMVMDNNSKLLNLSLADTSEMGYIGFEPNTEYNADDLVYNPNVDLGDNEFIGTNLKELIENEINLENLNE